MQTKIDYELTLKFRAKIKAYYITHDIIGVTLHFCSSALQENFQKIIELERDLIGIKNLVQAGRVGVFL